MRTAPIHEQLKAALTRSGWSVPELLQKSGLAIDRTLLWRKLNGKTKFNFEEVGVLVETFRRRGHAITIAWPTKAA